MNHKRELKTSKAIHSWRLGFFRGGHGLVWFCFLSRARLCLRTTPFSFRASHESPPSLADVTALSASFIQSSTAFPQSSAAEVVSGISNFFPFGIMHGGTESVQLFKHTLAGAPSSQDSSLTLVAQQEFAESCPRTDLQVG